MELAEVTASTSHAVAVVSISGEVDITNAGRVWEQLEQILGDESALVLSLEDCAYFDSNGITLLLRLHRRLSGGFGIVAPAGSPIRRLLEIAGLTGRLAVHESTGAAVDSVRRAIPK